MKKFFLILFKGVLAFCLMFVFLNCSKENITNFDENNAKQTHITDNILFDYHTQRYIYNKQTKAVDINQEEEAVLQANNYLDSLARVAEEEGGILLVLKALVSEPNGRELDSTDMEDPLDTIGINFPSQFGTLLKGASTNLRLPQYPNHNKYSAEINILRTTNGENFILDYTVLHTVTVILYTITNYQFQGNHYTILPYFDAGISLNLSYNNNCTNPFIIWSCSYKFEPILTF